MKKLSLLFTKTLALMIVTGSLSAAEVGTGPGGNFAPPVCCETQGGGLLGFAATEPGPFLDLVGKGEYFRLQLDIEGEGRVKVINPSAKKAAQVQLRMVDAAGQARTVALELPAGDTATVEVPTGAIHLMATSRQRIQLEMDYIGRVEMQKPGSRFLEECDPSDPGCDEPNYVDTICEGNWTLTCNTALSPGCAGLGPFTHYGMVDVYSNPTLYYVFWNLNTPTGNYTTEAPGGLTATWYRAGTTGNLRCPIKVLNSLGHWYNVTR